MAAQGVANPSTVVRRCPGSSPGVSANLELQFFENKSEELSSGSSPDWKSGVPEKIGTCGFESHFLRQDYRSFRD